MTTPVRIGRRVTERPSDRRQARRVSLGDAAWTRFASPSTSARSTATAPASAPPSPRWPPRCAPATGRRAAPVRAELPQPPDAADAPAAAAGRASPTRCGRAPTGPALDRWLGDAEVVHGTNYVVPPSRLPGRGVGLRLLVPDQPGAGRRRPCAAPARCCGGGCAAGRHRPRVEPGDGRRGSATLLGTDRVEVVHLGPLAARRRAAAMPPSAWAAALAGRPFVLALGTVERRKNLPALVAAFGAVAAGALDGAALVIAGARRRRRRRRRRGGRRARPAPGARRSCAPDRSTPPPRRGCCTTPRSLAYPSLDEGFGFPILEAQARRPAGRRDPRRLDPRGRRRRRRARRRRRRRRASPPPSRACSTTTPAAPR